jgi:hypothetical protein
VERHEIMDLFRAAVRDDDAEVDRLSHSLVARDWASAAGQIAAVFGLAVRRRFSPEGDPRSVPTFVSEARAEVGGDAIRPMEAEALVRAALGEAEPADIPREIAIPTEIVLAVKILREEHLSPGDMDAFLAEADALARRRDS